MSLNFHFNQLIRILFVYDINLTVKTKVNTC
jgi:hypothetical protein